MRRLLPSFLAIFLTMALPSLLTAQSRFPNASSAYRNLGTMSSQGQNVGTGILRLEVEPGVGGLDEGYGAAVPQGWVSAAGRDFLLARGMTLPSWVLVLEDVGVGLLPTSTDMGGQLVAPSGSLLDDFEALLDPSISVSQTHKTTETVRHVGRKMLSLMLGSSGNATTNHYLQAAQSLGSDADSMDWQVFGVPNWLTGQTPKSLWSGTFNRQGSSRHEFNAMRLTQNAFLFEAPSVVDGLSFVYGPEFNFLAERGQIGVSIQFICAKSTSAEDPGDLDDGSLILMASEPVWVTPSGVSGSTINPDEFFPLANDEFLRYLAFEQNFDSSFFSETEVGYDRDANGIGTVTIPAALIGQSLTVYDSSNNLVASIPLVPSTEPGVYVQPVPYFDPATHRFTAKTITYFPF